MSTVQEIQAAMKTLAPDELKRVREWLDNFIEDQLEFTGEFEAKIAESEGEMRDGKRPRVD
jgi:hypothetical protein